MLLLKKKEKHLLIVLCTKLTYVFNVEIKKIYMLLSRRDYKIYGKYKRTSGDINVFDIIMTCHKCDT